MTASTVQVQHPDGRSESIVAEYVLGADGPRSVVREAIGARYEGTHAQRPNLGVMFRSAELMDLLPHPPAVQSWLVNDRTPGVMGPVEPGRHVVAHRVRRGCHAR